MPVHFTKNLSFETNPEKATFLQDKPAVNRNLIWKYVLRQNNGCPFYTKAVSGAGDGVAVIKVYNTKHIAI